MNFDYNTIKSLGLAQSSTEASKKNELGQDMFMKLMITQLKNQNPLKPQEGAEFLSQLAQFSTVSGIQDLQKSFSGFASNMNEEQALQAANLVGKSVLIPSGKGILGAGADDKIEGELTLPAGAANVTVRVLDRSGAELRAIDLGAQDAGQVPFDWDGLVEGGMRANPGLYTIKAEAQIDGKTTALDTQVRTPVESVKLGGATGIEVDLGVLGKHALKDVQEIL